MKRLALLSIVLAMLVGVFIVTAPSLVSIEVVRRSITYEIAGWGGKALTFEGTPTVAFRPYLTVGFPKARIVSIQTGDTLVTTEMLSAQIPLVPLIFQGRIEPSAFDLRAPVFHFVTDAEGRPNWTLPYALDATTRVQRLSLTDGTIRYANAAGRSVEIDHVDALLKWPDPSGPASLSGKATWQGKPGTFSITIGSLLDFFEQRLTTLQLAVDAEPVRATFNGQVQQLDRPTASGDIAIQTPALHELANLFGLYLPDHAAFGAASLQGAVSLARGIATLPDAKLSIDGSDGEGGLSFDFTSARPSAQATLAFDDLDIAPFSGLAMDALTAARAQGERVLDFSALGQVDLDVRLSADRLLYGDDAIGRVAGSAALRAGRLDVALADMRLFDARVSASFSLDTGGPACEAAIRAQFDALSLKSLPTTLLPFLGTRGTAAGMFALTTGGDRWDALMNNLAGSGELTLSGGTLNGIDASALAKGWTDTTATDALSGKTDFTQASIGFSLGRDTLSIETGQLQGQGYTADFNGSADMARGAFDVHGSIDFDAGRFTPAKSVPFILRGDADSLDIAPGQPTP